MNIRLVLAVFILGFVFGNLYATWTLEAEQDILDCIELPDCPGLEEPKSGSIQGRVIWL